MENNSVYQVSQVENGKALRQLKLTASVLIVSFFIGFLVLGAIMYVTLQKFSDRVYVIGNGSSYFATAHDGAFHSEYEIENFVKVFLKTMYGHDANTFKQRVEKALLYTTKTDGQKIVDDFNRSRLHEQYIRSGASVRVEVDSIFIDMRKVPYSGMAFTRQIVFNGSREAVVPFCLKFNVGSLPRSSHNPFGLQIRDLIIFKCDLNEGKEEDMKAPSKKEEEMPNMEENLEEKTTTKVIPNEQRNKEAGKTAP